MQQLRPVARAPNELYGQRFDLAASDPLFGLGAGRPESYCGLADEEDSDARTERDRRCCRRRGRWQRPPLGRCVIGMTGSGIPTQSRPPSRRVLTLKITRAEGWLGGATRSCSSSTCGRSTGGRLGRRARSSPRRRHSRGRGCSGRSRFACSPERRNGPGSGRRP
jgi:hypothetical protein